jgi:hypothetical protein
MKKIKLNYIKILSCAFVFTLLSACTERGFDDYDAGGTPSEALNGEWFIDVSDEAGNVYVQHALHKTYDDNEGKMYVSDRIGPGDSDFSGWWLVSKVNYDVKTLTFSATDADNEADGSVVTITEGKILKNAGHTKTGGITDSIYFKGVFDYDPETVIIFSGHRRTGFHEDEY